MRPQLPDAERLRPYLERIDAARTYTNWGPLATELEQRLCMELGLPPGHVVSAGSGTAALVGAILATAGRPAGGRDLAIVPAFTFVATALAVEQAGYHPVLADVDRSTWALDPERVAEIELDRIGLVVPVAPFGRPVPQGPWVQFSEQTGTPVVIDGGASLEHLFGGKGDWVGPLPVALSFHATKSFSTAEGGGVVSADRAVCAAATRSLNFGFYEERDAKAESINGKMSEYHAAIGLAELDGWVSKRRALRAVADEYQRQFARAGLDERLFAAPDTGSTYVLFECDDPGEAVRVRTALEAANIDHRLWYGDGLQAQTYFRATPREELSVTEDLAPRLVGLPVFADMGEAGIARVVDTLASATR